MRVIQTERDAVAFMRSAKLALRYGSSAALPLPSIYSTAIDKRRAIELTNALLARADIVETNVIASRLVLVWRELVPALYALRVRFRGRLSADATRALELIRNGKASRWARCVVFSGSPARAGRTAPMTRWPN